LTLLVVLLTVLFHEHLSSLLSRSFPCSTFTSIGFLLSVYNTHLTNSRNGPRTGPSTKTRKTMGDRHNRKRTRNRPIRRQRMCPQFDQSAVAMTPSPTTSSSPSEQNPTPLSCSCWHPSARQTSTTAKSTSSKTKANPSLCLQTSRCSANPAPINRINIIPETPRSRTRRVFGGVDSSDDDRDDGDDDDNESMELCGPMLDIVLGLFGGVDYDYDD